jgi:DNA-binding NarL/FixJ family response regulator
VIRVVVCDDHAVVRAGLEQLIDTFADVRVAATASGATEAMEAIARDGADVVLMDLEMPPPDGIEATRMIMAAHPGAAVVILTSFSDRARILQALDAGAIGYLLKDATPGELESAIHAAARGESPMHPLAASALLSARSRPDPAAALSPREREVLALVAEGLPNKLIARRLEISEKTVKAHLTSVFRQIGADDRTQAALWAVRNGMSGDPGAGS